jgi:hypothetical protein
MRVTSFYNICGMEEDTTRCVPLPPCVQPVVYDVALGPPFECGDALQPPFVVQIIAIYDSASYD